jgi:hypothetical protein
VGVGECAAALDDSALGLKHALVDAVESGNLLKKACGPRGEGKCRKKEEGRGKREEGRGKTGTEEGRMGKQEDATRKAEGGRRRKEEEEQGRSRREKHIESKNISASRWAEVELEKPRGGAGGGQLRVAKELLRVHRILLTLSLFSMRRDHVTDGVPSTFHPKR